MDQVSQSIVHVSMIEMTSDFIFSSVGASGTGGSQNTANLSAFSEAKELESNGNKAGLRNGVRKIPCVVVVMGAQSIYSLHTMQRSRYGVPREIVWRWCAVAAGRYWKAK
jgi:hypothetical protein